MHLSLQNTAMALAVFAGLLGCAPQGPDVTRDDPEVALSYDGVETRLLDGDLVNFHVEMSQAQAAADVAAYAECAAAQYTLIRGYGFARHLRTTIDFQGGVWRGDAIYTISPALPRGLKTIDAEVVVSNCEENRIPTV